LTAAAAVSENAALDKFLASVQQYIDVDAVTGQPIVKYLKDEIIVKIKRDLIGKDAFVICLEQFEAAHGEWIGNNNCGFSFKRSVFPRSNMPVQHVDKLLDVPLSDLVAGPQPRIKNNDEKKQQITNSIIERVRQGYPPFTDRLKTRPSKMFPGKHEVIDGHTRVAIVAAFVGELATHFATVPIIEREMSDSEAWQIAYIANDGRDSFCDFDKGQWLMSMLQKFSDIYPDQVTLAEKIGEGYKRVNNLISFYEKTKSELAKLSDISVSRQREIKELPQSIAENALKAPEEIRGELLQAFVENKVTQKESREIGNRVNQKIQQLGTAPKAALTEVKIERANEEEALKARQAEAADRLRLEDAKVAKLAKYFPAGMVKVIVDKAGWVGEAKATQDLRGSLELEFWSKLTAEQQASFGNEFLAAKKAS
jgi:hypothetical protein